MRNGETEKLHTSGKKKHAGGKGREVGVLGAVVRARKPGRLPVVLTVRESKLLLDHLSGDVELAATILYGGGLHLSECLALTLTAEPNRRVILKLLFDATAETLFSFGRETFGGKVGFMLLLHTFDQRLRLHVHLHCLIASGALVTAGYNGQWVAGGRMFLFPVHGVVEHVPRGIPSKVEDLAVSR